MSCRGERGRRTDGRRDDETAGPYAADGEEDRGRRGTVFDSPNPHRLYRSTDDRWLAGVIGGVSAYIGARTWLLRLATIFGLIFFTPVVVGFYLLAWLILPSAPPPHYRSTEEERFWRSVAMEPKGTMDALRLKFRELERRMVAMEAVVTTPEFDLDRKIKDLDR